MIKTYLKKLHEIESRGDAREESYYSALADLLNDFAASVKREAIHITTIPKETDAGNPDFRVWDGKQHSVGYIEAKSPTVEHLDQVENSEQLKRYRQAFPNLILTNFLEFRLYRDGEFVEKALIARPAILFKLHTVPPPEKPQELQSLFEKFFSFVLPKFYNAETLAQELAKRTRFLRDEVVAMELRKDEKFRKDSILGFYEAFREYLISGLTPESFADLYAQTITYGLFAARSRAQNGFNRKLAYTYIPSTIGILRELFYFISGERLPKEMEGILDDIAEILSITDVKKVLQFQTRTLPHVRPRDPIVHFYETFLAKYDPATRERRGVYYTPEPVVCYVVESLHKVLQEQFQRPEGFANKNVTVLDPAAGTGTFLAETARRAVEEHISRFGEGGKEGFVRDHILKNFYAFELMMAPYAVGHLKLSYMLDELGCPLGDDDRFKLYLTNTLEGEDLAQTSIPGIAALAEESQLAGKIKKETPILVILGNPPYSGHSANASIKLEKSISPSGKETQKKVKTWIGSLIETYKFIDKISIGEANPKWLQDDYVKFIRFAQWKIDQAGEGVLGFITNHSYLDNPTFRGMRYSLLQSFDEIYLLDLHGNALKKEKCPDGSKDENVFDIRQGVAIAIFIKRKGKRTTCRVHHAELWGKREKKYGWLFDNSLKTTKWKKLTPKSPHYLFVPRDEELLALYESFPKITDVFPVNSVGIVTARDHLTIQWTPEEVWRTVTNFSRLDPEVARQTYELGKDAQDWKVELAQKDLKNSGPDKKHIVPILYRPFDVRYTYYTGKSQGFHCRPRPEVMRHMLRENIALCVGRAGQVVGLEEPWNIIFCSTAIADFNLFYRGGNVTFPLYLYDHQDKPPRRSSATALLLFEPSAKYADRTLNISSDIRERLVEAYTKAVPPENLVTYFYGILYSNAYRFRYAEYLKSDFPRLPFTSDYKLFAQISKLGQKLIDLHLLKEPSLSRPVAKFHGQGDGTVEKITYHEELLRVEINATQYFAGISDVVWRYQIGGYKVCEKWLKERKGKKLAGAEIEHYCKLITSLAQTIEIQVEIDKLYPEVEMSLLSFEG
jgi:hypothetical protein